MQTMKLNISRTQDAPTTYQFKCSHLTTYALQNIQMKVGGWVGGKLGGVKGGREVGRGKGWEGGEMRGWEGGDRNN